ncbi:TetR/AcrR family transcriptional regulator [Nocardia sp. alder85J]|uniref:TetR/AcrR family transcriptional regulator n=1 Tax=Nocardia sp. alder85J TaxID=2862949 RepID=UPI001CD42533|nr:TetR/AcrR family transcriptional regulator [Nocardia sp. alder85J]MCX4091822.1 TetR/AcrR family transcriptional regulator [Nocardia sp. alder85J]
MTTEDAVTDAPRRRRGRELEHALLEAAWAELADAGLARLTMESVAVRARTGVAVLYRRWPNKEDLVVDAIRHYLETHPVTIPDTGNLREDLRVLLTDSSDTRAELITLVGAIFAGLHDSTGLTPAGIRHELLGRNRLGRSNIVFERAHERGEIDLDRIPREILTVPFDLIRHEIFMTLEPVAPERIATIVDDIFWPLAERYSRGG